MNWKLFNFLFGILIIYANFDTSIGASLSKEDDEALRAVSTGMSQFSTDFYQTSTKDVTDNLICSPLSVGIVLAMTAYGARGNTENEMRTKLRISNDVNSKKGYQLLIDGLNSVKKVELNLAQKIFTADGFEVNSDFKEITDTYFRSESQSVDFNKPEEASQTINSWCEEKTKNRIKNVLQPDDVRGAMMVLVNAVYFKGNWKRQFKGLNTAQRPFYTDEKTTNDVETMFQESSFNYGTLPELDAVFVELPYESENEDDSISMFIILPNEIGGLTKATDKLETVNFQQLHTNRQMTMMRLFMPKFRIESTLNLQPVLETMGMGEMFSDKANFTGITENVPLKISKVVQKAFIEVNEKGSEAAAVTAVIAVPMSATISRPPPITVQIDRPFIYAIHHSATNTVMFQGFIKHPAMG